MSRLRIALVALLALLAACDSSTGADADAHVGTYTLVSVDGGSLPTSLGTIQGFDVTILSGRLSLNADGTASVSLRYRFASGGISSEETAADTGTYTRAGTSISIRWSGGDSGSFTLDEGRQELTTTLEGRVALFRK